MAWVAASIGVAGGLLGGMMGRSGQDKAAKRQAKLQAEQINFAKQQYQDYKDLYGDVEAGLIEEVESYVPGEKLQQFLGEGAADVAMAYDKREGMRTRELGRLGIDPSQERFQEDVSEVGRERALSEVGARTTARRKSEAEDDKIFARKLAMLSTGKQIPGQAGAVMGALQSGAQSYGEQAAQYGRGAAAGFGAAGQWGAKAISEYNRPQAGGGGMAGPDYSGAGYVPPGGSFDTNVAGAGYGDADVDYD